MTNIESIKTKKFFYKMGVLCGDFLYHSYKFEDFETMAEEAKYISNNYKDMQCCTFVIQAFRDNSYDFKKSCFYQTELFVYDIEKKLDSIAEAILRDCEEGGEG